MELVVRSLSLLLAALGVQSQAQQAPRGEKLSAPQAEAAPSSLSSFGVSSDGGWVLYTVGTPTTSTLHATRGAGGPGAQISGVNHFVNDYRLSPRGRRVVYRVEGGLFTTDGLGAPRTLYSEPNQSLVEREDSYRLTPDGSQAVILIGYREVPFDEITGHRLLSSVIDASRPAIDLAPGFEPASFDLAPDGMHVVFTATELATQRSGVYLVPLDGSRAPRSVSGDLPSFARVQSVPLAVSPDGARVLYRVDDRAAGRFELLSAPLRGNADPVRLSGAASMLEGVLAFHIAPNGGRVVYRTTGGLYSTSIDGSEAAIRLSPGGLAVGQVRIAPDATRVAFRTEAPNAPWHLYSVPIEGGLAPVGLDTGIEPQGIERLGVGRFEFSADASRVLFLSDRQGREEFWSIPSDGSAPAVRLSRGRASHFQLEPGGSRVAFTDARERPELFVAPIDGSQAPLRLSPEPREETVVQADIVFHPGGNVFFRGNFAADVGNEILVAPADGSAPARALTDRTPAVRVSSNVLRFEVSPDGEWVAYAGAGGTYVLPTCSPRVRRRLDASLYSADQYQPFYHLFGLAWLEFSRDSSQVGFLAHGRGSGLYVAAPDGSTPPVLTTRWGIPPRYLVGEAGFSPDGRWVVCESAKEGPLTDFPELLACLGTSDGGPEAESIGDGIGTSITTQFTSDSTRLLIRDGYFSSVTLRSIALDGSGTAELAPADTGLNFGGFFPVDDGTLLLFAGESVSDQMYRASVDGSEPPALLAEFGSGLRALQLTPDRTRVVYSWGGTLYQVPVDGSEPARLVVGIFTDGSETLGLLEAPLPLYRLTADSTRVLFGAQRSSTSQSQIFAVPLDGSTAPQAVTEPFVGLFNQGLRGMEISPDGTRLAFTGGLESSTTKLYSMLVGGGPVVELGNTLLPGLIRITPDSTAVIFGATVGTHREVHLVPITGETPPEVLTNRLAQTLFDPRREAFQFSPDLRWIYYVADRDTPRVYELYRAPVRRVGGAASAR